MNLSIAKALLAIVAVVAVVGANWISWNAARAPALKLDATLDATLNATGASWQELQGVVTKGDHTTFPAALIAREGQLLTLTGVLFALPQMVVDGRLHAAVLAPPAKFSCCGLSCDAGSAALVCVIPRDPPADPGQRRMARVTGTLALQREASGLTSVDLRDATITWLADP